MPHLRRIVEYAVPILNMDSMPVPSDMGTNLRPLCQRSCSWSSSISPTSPHSEVKSTHFSWVRGQRSDTLNVCLVSDIPVQGSGVSEMKVKSPSEAGYWSEDCCVFFEDARQWKWTSHQNVSSAAASLNTERLRGSPSESKHPGPTEDMFDTRLLSSLRNVWTEKTGEYFPKYAIVQSSNRVFRAYLSGERENTKNATRSIMTRALVWGSLVYFIVVDTTHYSTWITQVDFLRFYLA